MQSPVVVLHESSVQTLWSSQASGVPALHVPAWQVSAPLQRFPSPQDVPFGSVECWQPPTGSHASVVQALPSLQALPSAFAGFEQAPLAGSQVPAVWH
jgi:hypothetical protein